MANLQVGQNFSSFLEFEKCLSSFENENFVKFTKRDSRKIESAVQSGKTKVELNPALIYYEIKYNCVRGGVLRLKGKGIRRTSSRKIECAAHISLRATADGKSLEVKSFDNTHNHEISKELYDHLPHQRQLSKTEKIKARELLALKANRKLVQQKLQEETGKIITLRDLSNLAKGVKNNSNELHEAVSFLQRKYCKPADRTDINNPDWIPTENIEFKDTDKSVEGDVARQKQISISSIADKEFVDSSEETPFPVTEKISTLSNFSETEETSQDDESQDTSLINNYIAVSKPEAEVPNKRPRVYVLCKKTSPKRTFTTKGAEVLIDESKNRVEKSDYAEIEHNLRVERLRRQIELVQKKIDVQNKLLEILDKNPEKLNLKF